MRHSSPPVHQDRFDVEEHPVVTEEEATAATHVGLWKILAVSLALVVIGFAIVSGFNNGFGA